MISVNVGNASLNALKQPPKFACIVTLGLPRVGTTTACRGVVNSLVDDGLPWSFFSGGDHLRDLSAGGEKQSPWEASKAIFDALSNELDDRIKGQLDETTRIRGLLIDKHFRGLEDLYYLAGLLRAKKVALHGIVAIDCDDDALIARLQKAGEFKEGTKEVEQFRERLRFRRVLLTQLKEVGKALGIWHTVDSDQEIEDVKTKLRGVVLGCSAKPPAKGEILDPSMYGGNFSQAANASANQNESNARFVDSVDVYFNVMSSLMNLVRTPYRKYPGTTPKPLSRAVMVDNRINFRDQYFVRRKSEGIKYVLFYDGTGLYLVPRHMRCVLQLPDSAWIGVPLKQVNKFVLEGELTKLSKERNREKFLVHDALAWCERDSTTNIIARSPWRDRHELLTTRLCNEASAFFSRDNVLVCHQLSVPFSRAQLLFELCDYPTEGICLQPAGMPQRWDAVFLWRSPELITIDFRLGRIISGGDASTLQSPQASGVAGPMASSSGSGLGLGSEASSLSLSPDAQQQLAATAVSRPPPTPSSGKGVRTYVLEVFDHEASPPRYVEFRGGSETVNIKGGSRAGIVQGAIVVCAIDPSVLNEKKLMTGMQREGSSSQIGGAASATPPAGTATTLPTMPLVAPPAAAAGGLSPQSSPDNKTGAPTLNATALLSGLAAAASSAPTNPHWVFLKVRSDVFTAAMRTQAEEILTDCLISRAELCVFLGVAPAAAATTTTTGAPAQQQTQQLTAAAASSSSGMIQANSGSMGMQQQSSSGATGSYMNALGGGLRSGQQQRVSPNQQQQQQQQSSSNNNNAQQPGRRQPTQQQIQHQQHSTSSAQTQQQPAISIPRPKGKQQSQQQQQQQQKDAASTSTAPAVSNEKKEQQPPRPKRDNKAKAPVDNAAAATAAAKQPGGKKDNKNVSAPQPKRSASAASSSGSSSSDGDDGDKKDAGDAKRKRTRRGGRRRPKGKEQKDSSSNAAAAVSSSSGDQKKDSAAPAGSDGK